MRSVQSVFFLLLVWLAAGHALAWSPKSFRSLQTLLQTRHHSSQQQSTQTTEASTASTHRLGTDAASTMDPAALTAAIMGAGGDDDESPAETKKKEVEKEFKGQQALTDEVAEDTAGIKGGNSDSVSRSQFHSNMNKQVQEIKDKVPARDEDGGDEDELDYDHLLMAARKEWIEEEEEDGEAYFDIKGDGGTFVGGTGGKRTKGKGGTAGDGAGGAPTGQESVLSGIYRRKIPPLNKDSLPTGYRRPYLEDRPPPRTITDVVSLQSEILQRRDPLNPACQCIFRPDQDAGPLTGPKASGLKPFEAFLETRARLQRRVSDVRPAPGVPAPSLAAVGARGEGEQQQQQQRQRQQPQQPDYGHSAAAASGLQKQKAYTTDELFALVQAL